MREKKAQVGGFNIFPHSNHLLSPVCLCVLGGGNVLFKSKVYPTTGYKAMVLVNFFSLARLWCLVGQTPVYILL